PSAACTSSAAATRSRTCSSSSSSMPRSRPAAQPTFVSRLSVSKVFGRFRPSATSAGAKPPTGRERGEGLDPSLSFRLRAVVASDAPAISACVKAAYAQWIPVIGREPWPMLQDYAAVIETEQVVVAETNGAIAGVLVLSTTADGFLIE